MLHVSAETGAGGRGRRRVNRHPVSKRGERQHPGTLVTHGQQVISDEPAGPCAAGCDHGRWLILILVAAAIISITLLGPRVNKSRGGPGCWPGPWRAGHTWSPARVIVRGTGRAKGQSGHTFRTRCPRENQPKKRMAQELHLFQHSLDKESRRVRNICFENKFDRSGCVDTHSTEAPIVRGGTTYAEQGESLAETWKGEWWPVIESYCTVNTQPASGQVTGRGRGRSRKKRGGTMDHSASQDDDFVRIPDPADPCRYRPPPRRGRQSRRSPGTRGLRARGPPGRFRSAKKFQ